MTKIEETVVMLQDCMNRAELLSEWESNFIQSLHERVMEATALTPRQVEVLDGIWEKVTA